MSNDNVVEFPSHRVRRRAPHTHRARRGGAHPPARAPGPARNAALLATVLMMLGASETRTEVAGLARRLAEEIDPITLREVLVEASARIGDMVCLCIEDVVPEGSA